MGHTSLGRAFFCSCAVPGRVQLFATPWPECIIIKIFVTADNLTEQNYPHFIKSTTGYLDNDDGTAAKDKIIHIV